jgi:nucleoid-associated protein YgaU
MTETTRNYRGIATLALLGAVAIGALIYLKIQPQPQPAPPPPAVTAQAPAPTPGPVFDVVRVDPQGNVVLAGRAAPGAKVTIKSGSTVIGSTTADAQGAFVLLPTNPLPPGGIEISLSETLPNGKEIAGTGTASIDIPATAGQSLAVLSGPNGSTVVSGQGPRPGTLGLGTVDYDANGHAIFSGTAPAGARVTLSLGGHTVGHAVAGGNGRWKFSADIPRKNGTLTLSANDAGGAVLPPVSAPFALETLPDALAAGHIVITPGDNLWLIARHVYGSGNMYTVIYNANATKIHDPNLIFPGQGFALPKPQG